jgi:glutamate 5-kinase
VVGVEGSFAGGQAVRIVVRRRKGLAAGVGSALAKSVISYANVENESPATIPSSPLLKPVTSTSTSISSIDPLSSAMGSRHVSISDAAHMAALSATPHASVDGAGVGMAVGYTIPEHDGTTAEKEAEWEDVEVGRGLTNYNSAEIDKVKGRKRFGLSFLFHL